MCSDHTVVCSTSDRRITAIRCRYHRPAMRKVYKFERFTIRRYFCCVWVRSWEWSCETLALRVKLWQWNGKSKAAGVKLQDFRRVNFPFLRKIGRVKFLQATRSLGWPAVCWSGHNAPVTVSHAAKLWYDLCKRPTKATLAPPAAAPLAVVPLAAAPPAAARAVIRPEFAVCERH